MDAELLAQLDAETATVRTELGRTAALAGHLLTVALGGLTALVAIGPGRHLPPAGVVLGVAGTVADVTSVVLLGLVLFPRLGHRRAGWLAHTRRTAQQILRHAAGGNPETERAEQLAALSRLAAWKFRLIQLAEVALGVAVLLVLAAAVV